MPYISEEDRLRLAGVKETIEFGPEIETPGELQYLISVCISKYMQDKPTRYQTMNDVMGALNGANQEFYRVVVGPYEDKAIVKNGIIPGYNLDV